MRRHVVSAGESAHDDTYARGQSKQEAAGSHHYDLDFGEPTQEAAEPHHYDVDFGEQPTQEAGHDHADADMYGEMAVNEGFYDQDHPDANK